ncbi:MAG: hypothetical protein E7641_06385 [Ruminococcaceae bacterium]|nr:hypothetical protein [Oscillospiraceae bacterium]
MIKTIGPKFRRAIHYDFHTSPGIENIFGNFDAEKFASQLEEAKVEYVNVAARCNMGFSYYNTKVGKKYPGLGDRDPLAEMIDACHAKNIGVTAYINIGLDHEISADNHSWLKIEKDGRIYRNDKKDNFFRVMCYNSGYRAHFMNEIREICEYDIDGLFCDCFTLRACYCPNCMKDMLAKGIDVNDDAAVVEYQNTVRLDFAEDIKKAMGDKLGKIKLYINGMSWTVDCQTHAEIECLSSDPSWGYDYFDSMAAYTRTMYEDRVYMSGRFQNSWGDFGGLKPVASMQNDLYDAMMNSFGISYGDHMHPVDGFENEVANRIGAVMKEKIAYEPYTENSENLIDIGVIIHSNDRTRRLPYFAKGAARILKELKLQYNVYDENGAFEDAKLLIVGEGADFDDAFKARLAKYIKNGGKVIFSGPAVDLGKEIGALDYVDVIGKDTRDNAYYTVEGSDMRWAMYDPAMIIKNLSGTEAARYVSNILNFTWDGRQSCYYRPQGEVTEYSAAVIGENTACVCFDIFKAYADNFLVEHRELLDTLIRALMPERLIECEGMPKTATVALTQNATSTVFHVKATYPEHKMIRGIIEEHNYMKSAKVSISGEYDVYKLPENEKVDSVKENGRTVFETGDLLGYRAFLLK